MNRIRLARRGRHKRAFFHIVIIDQKASRDGGFIEKIGTYDPIKKTEKRSEKVSLDMSRYNYWVSVGAQPSETVKKLVSILQ